MAMTRMRFGRYKDAPLDVVRRDANYVRWLLAQPWFAEKFPDLAAELRGDAAAPPAPAAAAIAPSPGMNDPPALIAQGLLYFRRISGAVPPRAYTTCIECGRPLKVAIGEIHPVWILAGEVVGVICERSLESDARQRLADFRTGRLRLPSEAEA